MPYDPRIRGSVSVPVRTTNTTPEVRTPTAPAPQPQPAPTRPAGTSGLSTFEAPRTPRSTVTPTGTRSGVNDDAIGVHDDAIGVHDDAIGVHDDAIGVHDDAIGVHDDAIGVHDDAIGVNDDAIGVNEDAIGVNDDAIGGVGPKRSRAEAKLNQTIDALFETPTYLKAGRREPQPSRPPKLDEAKALAGSTLSASLARGLVGAASADARVGARLETIAAAAKGLPEGARAALLGVVARAPHGVQAIVAQHLVSSPTWTQASAADKAKLASVLGSCDPRGAQLFGALVEKLPHMLPMADSKGATLLDNLSTLATQPLSARLVGLTTNSDLVRETLRDIVNPNRIDQGYAPTCSVASLQYELALEEPSEYARLLAEFTGPRGSAKLRGGGDARLETRVADPKAAQGRSASEMIFQSSLMEYANGKDNYDPERGYSVNRGDRGTDAKKYAGLGPHQQKRLLSQVFGVKYSSSILETEAESGRALERLRKYDPMGPEHKPVIFEINQGSFNHAVTFEQVKGGRVFFRDPYGVPRSIPEEMFVKHVVAMHYPTGKL